jgi:hypothetical protein
MRNDLHDDDPKKIWQNQPTETSTMSLILIRQKARELHAKTRRELLGTLTVPVVIAFFYAFSIKQFPDLRQVLYSLFAFALAWSIAGLYFLNRGKRPREMPGDAGFSTGLEFCRQEIERRGDYFRGILLWSFGPVLLAIGTFFMALAAAAGTAIFLKAMPFMTLVVVWIAAYFLIRARQQRELRRELDELSKVERENSR